VAVLTVVTLLFLTGLFEDLPEATLAAVVIAALVELVDVRALVKLYRVYTGPLGRIYGFAARADFLAAVAALLGVLVFDTLPGLFIGITISVLLLVYRASRPHVATLGTDPSGVWVDTDRHPDARVRTDVMVVRPEGGLFYANAETVRHELLARLTPATTAVVLDAQSVPALDVTAGEMLTALYAELERRGVRFLIARDVGQVRDVLDHSDAADLSACLHSTVRDVIASLDTASPEH
jgi:sulfate permease, SulP family